MAVVYKKIYIKKTSEVSHTFAAIAKAYSATTIFPADIWAATMTDPPSWHNI
jgi:hypothetical protein